MVFSNFVDKFKNLRIMIKVLVFLLLISYSWQDDTAELVEAEIPEKLTKVKYLEADMTIHYRPLHRRGGLFANDLRTYCYRGNPRTLSRLFETIEIQFDIENDDYMQYEGNGPEEVRANYEERQSLFSLSLFSQKKTRLQLSPFDQQCIGIETLQPYRVHLRQMPIDIWRVIQMTMGICAFIYAAKLSQNDLFYYITGVIFGICSSFMLLIWLSSKLLPRKTMVYGALVGGWAIGLYMIRMLWQNLQTIIIIYKDYVLWYIFGTGLISFFFCYRWGPPKNKRSKQIIKWCLQLFAMILIYFSTKYEEGGIAVCILTAVYQYFPYSILARFRKLYVRLFPPKRRFLTNEEYYEQGVRETTKALQELREYASSPDCNQWKIISRLRDPFRFASFVEGASHLKDEEILSFEGYANDEMNDSDVNDEITDEYDNDAFYNRRIRGHSTQRRSMYMEDDEDYGVSDDYFENDMENSRKSFLSLSAAYKNSGRANAANSTNYSLTPNNSNGRITNRTERQYREYRESDEDYD